MDIISSHKPKISQLKRNGKKFTKSCDSQKPILTTQHLETKECLTNVIKMRNTETSYWKKFKKLMGRTLQIFLIIYGLITFFWLVEIILKCRVPNYEKSSYTSYFSGPFYFVDFTKDEQDQSLSDSIIVTPGLACIPKIHIEYISSTLESLMENILHYVNSALDFVTSGWE